MSTTIIYHMAPMVLPVALTGQAEDLILIAVQVGSSNCYEVRSDGRNGRRSRSWEALHFGTREQVLAEGIAMAGSFEGGAVVLDRYRNSTVPEQYIRRVRRMLEKAAGYKGPGMVFKDGYVSVYARRRATVNGREVREIVPWDNAEEVRQYISDIRSDPEPKQPYAYFQVSGPALR